MSKKYPLPPDTEFGPILRAAATAAIRVDGDRDYMNPSDLTVQQTMAMADLLRLAALRIDPGGKE